MTSLQVGADLIEQNVKGWDVWWRWRMKCDEDACLSSSIILFTLYPSETSEEKEGQMCS